MSHKQLIVASVSGVMLGMGLTCVQMLPAIANPGFLLEQMVRLQKPQVRRAQEAESMNYIGAMNRAQQAYYLENDKFTGKLEDLGLMIPSETQHYRYQLLLQGQGKQQRVVNLGIAKRDQLRSYLGLVSFGPTGNEPGSSKEVWVTAAICRSKQPTRVLPSPEVLAQLSTDRPCPEGYARLQR